MGSKFNMNALAVQRGREFGIHRNKDESPDNYRLRVVGELRARGNFIEAHEAYSGRLYDDPEQGPTGPMAGISGALVQALYGWEYSPHDPERQVGDDIAVGVVSLAGKDRMGRDRMGSTLETLFRTFGSEAGVDILGKMRGKKWN